MVKYFINVFLAVMLLGLIFSSSFAQAASQSGGSAGLVGSKNPGGCSGCGSGPVTWYITKNTNFGSGPAYAPGFNFGSGGDFNGSNLSNSHLAYPASTLDAIRRNLQNKKTTQRKGSVQATSAILDLGDGQTCNGFYSPTCPLWWNQTRKSPSLSSSGTINHVFGLSPNGGVGIENQIAGYNVKVWRENPQANRFELIFQRQIGVGQFSATGNFSWSGPAQENWWYGGTGTSASGRSVSGGQIGGNYYARGGIARGMIGSWGIPQAHDACEKNVASGSNPITRKANGKPRNLPLRYCYWEGGQMGPNGLDINSMSAAMRDIWGLPNWQARMNNNVPSNQFGDGIDNKSIRTGGWRESFRFKWFIPNRGGGSGFEWYMRSAPGLFYAIQVVAVDNRGGIVGMDKKDFVYGIPDPDGGGSAASNRQFFKVFMNNTGGPVCVPTPCNNPCGSAPDCPPDPQSFGLDEPSASLSLTGEGVLQVNEDNAISTSLDSTESDDGGGPAEGQLIIPREVSINHFTPQANVSSSTVPGANVGDTLYSNDYSLYRVTDSVTGTEEAVQPNVVNPETIYDPPSYSTDPFRMPSQNNSTGFKQHLQVARISTSAPRDISSTNQLNDSVANDFSITWLRPTISNPCDSTSIPAFPYPDRTPPAWPKNPQSCEPLGGGQKNDVVNAWDDMIFADASWEAQWPDRLINEYASKDTIGMIEDQWLRCNQGGFPGQIHGNFPIEENTEGSVPARLTAASQSVSAQGRTFTADQRSNGLAACINPTYPLKPQAEDPLNWRNQTAQGVLVAQSTGTHAKVNVTLNTNRPEKVGGLTVERLLGEGEGTETVGYNLDWDVARNGKNVNLNFCRDGVPENTTLLDSSNSPYTPTAQETGDPGCRGYAIKWYWDTDTNATCSAAGLTINWSNWSRGANERTMAKPSSIPGSGVPLANSNAHSNQYGTYAQAGFSFPKVPYYGRRPGNADNNWSACVRNYNNGASGANRKTLRVNGWIKTGQWKTEVNAQKGFGRGNNGGRLPVGTYSFNFKFNNLTAADLNYRARTPGISNTNINTNNCPAAVGTGISAPGTCWTMKADYQGFVNRIMVSNTRTIADENMPSMYVAVYGPRADR